MPKLSEITYFPTLRTRAAELRGLKELDDDRKKKIIPLLTLGSWRGSPELSKAAEKCVDAMGGLPFFMDLSSDSRKVEENLKQLNDSNNAYENWRAFSREVKGAIPVVLMQAGAKTRDIVQQASAIEDEHEYVAFE